MTHNLEPLLDSAGNARELLMAGKEGTLWYYRSLLTAFKPRAEGRLWHELERTVAAIEKLAGPPPTS